MEEVTHLTGSVEVLTTITRAPSRIQATFGRGCLGYVQHDLAGKRDRGLYLQGKWLRKGEEWLYGKKIAFCTVGSILQD